MTDSKSRRSAQGISAKDRAICSAKRIARRRSRLLRAARNDVSPKHDNSRLSAQSPRIPSMPLNPWYRDWGEVRIRSAIAKLEKAIAVAVFSIEIAYGREDSPWRASSVSPYDAFMRLTKDEYEEFIRVIERYPVAADRLMAEQEAILFRLIDDRELFASGLIARRVGNEGNRNGR